MRALRFVPAALLLIACHESPAPARDGSAKTLSPFAAAPGVSRAAGADDRAYRIVPLRPIAGDVEILNGDPEKPGEPFVMRIRELPGTMIPLHSHPVDENITVVQGSWYFAVGNKWDRAALKELRPGDYAFAPKGSTMFGYCPDGAVVQVHGIGPFLIHWMHGAKTLDESDAAATFTLRKGERVHTPRGDGTIRQGYASGEIVQYEIEGADGSRFMANQSEVRRI
jgi:quercetin dioxygenase-like cupin family protein